jgi:hypothetical protein
MDAGTKPKGVSRPAFTFQAAAESPPPLLRTTPETFAL